MNRKHIVNIGYFLSLVLMGLFQMWLAWRDVAQFSGMFPVPNVFFKRARQGGMEAFRLSDMLRHRRFPSTQQFLACPQLVDQPFRESRRSGDAALFALDRSGDPHPENARPTTAGPFDPAQSACAKPTR